MTNRQTIELFEKVRSIIRAPLPEDAVEGNHVPHVVLGAMRVRDELLPVIAQLVEQGIELTFVVEQAGYYRGTTAEYLNNPMKLFDEKSTDYDDLYKEADQLVELITCAEADWLRNIVLSMAD